MKKAILSLLIIGMSLIIYYSFIKKAAPGTTVFSIPSGHNMNTYLAVSKQIEDAKTFFVSHTDTSVQKFKKTALWDKAYITKSQAGDKVTVALKYDKNYAFKTLTSGVLYLEKQSNLYVYKDSLQKFHSEIIVTAPDKVFLENPETGFSGYILHQDWAGNTLQSNHYINGKEVSAKQSDDASNINALGE